MYMLKVVLHIGTTKMIYTQAFPQETHRVIEVTYMYKNPFAHRK